MKKYKLFENFFRNSEYWKEWRTVDESGGIEFLMVKKLIRTYGSKRIKVLDLACGHGRLLKQLSKEFKNLELYGFDINRNAIRIAKRAVPKAEIKVGSVYKLPYKNRFFDLVIIAASFMHFEKPENALQEITRVAKGDVFFDLSTKTNISEFLRDIKVMGRSSVPEKRYDIADIKKILPKNFKWDVRGFSLFSHKLLTKRVFNYYKKIDVYFPKSILNRIGHLIIVYGQRKT